MPTLNVDQLLTELTLEEKASLFARLRFLAHRAGRAPGHSRDHGLRRTAWSASSTRTKC